MPNYYEMLQIETTASTEEIVNAIDSRYNQTRKLVTHHDPNIVNQANQALQLLETIRGTLTDSSKRQVYDEAIGLRGMTGGLFDPSVIINQMPSMPVVAKAPDKPVQQVTQVVAASQTPGLWACPKCKTDNPPQAVHCFKCGTQLVRQCPECDGVSSLIATGMCGNCGFHFDVASQRRKLRDLIGPAQAEAQRLETAYRSASLKKPGASGCGIWLAIIALIAAVVLCTATEGEGMVPAIVTGLIGVGIIVLMVASYAKKKDTYASETDNARNLWDAKVKDLTRMVNEYKSLELDKSGH